MSKFGRPEQAGIFDLAAIDTELRATDAYAREGHTAHTLLREDDLRIVVIVMKVGARMAEHRANETASIHGLSGHVRLRLPDETTDVRAGQLLVLQQGLPHDVEAVLDSAFLLTLGWPPASQESESLLRLEPDTAGAKRDDAIAGLPHATMRFERRIDALSQQVWDAYADVNQRAVWSVPEGEAVTYDASDFRPGGIDEYRCGAPNDLANHVTTRYHHIDQPHSYVASNEIRHNGETIATDLTQWILRSDGSSTIVTIIVQVTSLAGDSVLGGYRNGHERTLDHLEKYLRAARAGDFCR